MTLIFDGWPWKTIRAPLPCYFKLRASFCSHWSIRAGVKDRKRPIWVKIGDFFVPSDLEIWRMILKNNTAHFLFFFKVCASFRSCRAIQTGVTVRKCPIWVKSGDSLSRVTLKFDGWPWKTIGPWRELLNFVFLFCFLVLYLNYSWFASGFAIDFPISKLCSVASEGEAVSVCISWHHGTIGIPVMKIEWHTSFLSS